MNGVATMFAQRELNQAYIGHGRKVYFTSKIKMIWLNIFRDIFKPFVKSMTHRIVVLHWAIRVLT